MKVRVRRLPQDAGPIAGIEEVDEPAEAAWGGGWRLLLVGGPRWLISGSLIALLLLLASATERSAAQEAPENTEVRCLGCHDRESLVFELPSGETIDATVDGETYEGSAHGSIGLECTSCHSTITEWPHPDVAAADARSYTVEANEACVGCHRTESEEQGGVHHAALAAGGAGAPVCSDCHGAHEVVATPSPLERAATCEGCHDTPEFEGSVHQQALADGNETAPACSDCHGSHSVEEPDEALMPTCAACHEGPVSKYETSVHGLAHERGDQEAAVCSSCHGPAHTTRAADDLASSTYPLRLPQTCGACHGDPEVAEEHGLANVYEQYIDSIHGRAVMQRFLLVAANCSTCHGSHDIKPHDDPASRVFAANIPATCGSCHGEIEQDWDESVHGQAVAAGDLRGAVCIDCHTAHEIIGVGTLEWKLDVVRECGTCHEESLTTYRDTFHGQVTSLGFTRVARCSDCHGFHTIRPTEHPESSVAAGNIVATCQKCHPAANANFTQFSPHADPDNPEDGALLYFTDKFMTSLVAGVLGFFGVHTVLWGVRSRIEHARLLGDGGRGSEGEQASTEGPKRRRRRGDDQTPDPEDLS